MLPVNRVRHTSLLLLLFLFLLLLLLFLLLLPLLLLYLFLLYLLLSSFYFSAVSKGRQTAPPILSANVRI